MKYKEYNKIYIVRILNWLRLQVVNDNKLRGLLNSNICNIQTPLTNMEISSLLR